MKKEAEVLGDDQQDDNECVDSVTNSDGILYIDSSEGSSYIGDISEDENSDILHSEEINTPSSDFKGNNNNLLPDGIYTRQPLVDNIEKFCM